MYKYIIKRILALIPVLFVVSILIFTLIHLTPGDPARVMLGELASEEDVNALREAMGLNDALVVQYLSWVTGLFRGDLGESIFMSDSMSTIIVEHLGPTLMLTFYSLIFAIIIALPMGIIAAKRRGTLSDTAISTFSMMGISIPSFLLGLFLILLFAVRWKLLPVGGYKPVAEAGFMENLRYMILPSAALGMIEAGLLIRMTRSSVLDVLASDYVKMARSKGVREFVIVCKHSLKNAMLPILTSIGQAMIGLLSGAAVVESVFNIPGIGQLVVNSVNRRDYEVIQIIVLLTTLINVLVCLAVDILYGLLDPRVRMGKQ